MDCAPDSNNTNPGNYSDIYPKDTSSSMTLCVDRPVQVDTLESSGLGISLDPIVHGYDCSRGELVLTESELNEVQSAISEYGFRLIVECVDDALDFDQKKHESSSYNKSKPKMTIPICEESMNGSNYGKTHTAYSSTGTTYTDDGVKNADNTGPQNDISRTINNRSTPQASTAPGDSSSSVGDSYFRTCKLDRGLRYTSEGEESPGTSRCESSTTGDTSHAVRFRKRPSHLTSDVGNRFSMKRRNNSYPYHHPSHHSSAAGTLDASKSNQSIQGTSSRGVSVSHGSQLGGHTGSSSVTGSDVKTTALPVRQSRRLREPLAGRWQDYCLEVQDKLERHRCAKWFLFPVNPELDGVPDYFDVVKTPMDLNTVREKLENGHYTHPFRWQFDVRQIFYNAFKYHPDASPIWKEAHTLAVAFEQWCKETEGVNPYAVFASVPAEKPSADIAKSLQKAETANDNEKIVMDVSELKMLLEKAAKSSQLVKQTERNTTDTNQTPRNKSRKNENNSVAPATESFNRGSQIIFYSAKIVCPISLPLSMMPAPPTPSVVPLAGKSAAKVMNSIQKKSLILKFKDWDVSYRKAALDLVKNELGIHPTLCAMDVRYIPHMELLPNEKQQTMLRYLKCLDTRHEECLSRGYMPTKSTVLDADGYGIDPSMITALPMPNEYSDLSPFNTDTDANKAPTSTGNSQISQTIYGGDFISEVIAQDRPSDLDPISNSQMEMTPSSQSSVDSSSSSSSSSSSDVSSDEDSIISGDENRDLELGNVQNSYSHTPNKDPLNGKDSNLYNKTMDNRQVSSPTTPISAFIQNSSFSDGLGFVDVVEGQDSVSHDNVGEGGGGDDDFTKDDFSVLPLKSAWSEWKTKVIQDSYLMSQRPDIHPTPRERLAEQADAEI